MNRTCSQDGCGLRPALLPTTPRTWGTQRLCHPPVALFLNTSIAAFISPYRTAARNSFRDSKDVSHFAHTACGISQTAICKDCVIRPPCCDHPAASVHNAGRVQIVVSIPGRCGLDGVA